MAKNNTDNNKENKKPLFRRILVAFFFIDLIVGIIFLICYFKGCSPFNRTTSSSSISSSIDNTDYQQLDNKFKQLVKTQMELDGFDNEEINQVVTVTYQENAHVSFDLTISAVSESNLYVFSLKDVQYKEGTDTLVSYLLCNNEIEGGTNLYKEQLTNDLQIVPNGRYVISVPTAGSQYEHKTGYELKDDGYHVMQLIEYKNTDSGSSSLSKEMIIKEDMPLYNYYSYLNK